MSIAAPYGGPCAFRRYTASPRDTANRAVQLRALGAEVRMCAPPEEDFTELLARVGMLLVPPAHRFARLLSSQLDRAGFGLSQGRGCGQRLGLQRGSNRCRGSLWPAVTLLA